jgi:hypothetical protein
MAEQADDYHRGEMDIQDHVKTYHAFLAMAKWFSLVLAVSILFLVVLFSTEAGFLGAAGAAVVVLVLGIFFLREKPKPH